MKSSATSPIADLSTVHNPFLASFGSKESVKGTIRVVIDRSTETAEQRAWLESQPEYHAFVDLLALEGRKHGVAMVLILNAAPEDRETSGSEGIQP